MRAIQHFSPATGKSDVVGVLVISLNNDIMHSFLKGAPLAPGAPLCRAHSPDPAIDGLQISLKGGQTGAPDFFSAALKGGA